MAVAPTGAIYKALEFDGVSSRAYGVYITGEAVYNAPERDVEMITIPGRNGTYALDNGRFENIPVTYPAGIFADTEADFRQAISEFRNFLCSRKGYVRLQDEYNPDEYRMAVYKSGLEVDPAMLRAGEFDIVFDCKPQRYLTSGEEPITLGFNELTDEDDTSPYFMRRSPQLDVDYDAEKDTIVGASAGWNQKINNGNFESSTNWSSAQGSFTVSNNEATVTTTGTYGQISRSIGTYISGHKYLFLCYAKSADGLNVSIGASAMSQAHKWHTLTSSYQQIWHIANCTNPTGNTVATIATNNGGDNKVFVAKEAMCIDLTQMFGSTIADYIYTLESGTAGAGVAKLKEWGFFSEPYYAYNQGEIKSVSGLSAHKMVGFNQASSINVTETDAIWTATLHAEAELLPNTSYCISFVGVNNNKLYTNENLFTNVVRRTCTGNREYIVVTTVSKLDRNNTRQYINGKGWVIFKNDGASSSTNTVVAKFSDVCINISKTTGTPKNGDYEAYTVNEYALDSTVTLRGKFMLDANNNIVANGDVYPPSGEVARKWKKVTVDGSNSFTYQYNGTLSSGYIACFINLADKAYGVFNMISDKFEVNNNSLLYTVCGRINNGGIQYVLPSTVTPSNDGCKAYFTSNPTDLVYELATPTTETADPFASPQNVDKNGTEEYVSTGLVPIGHKTRYGKVINDVVNPTLFESSPLLEVEGYGTIEFNGYEIEFDNAMLGPVVIFDGDAMPWDATSINIASPLYNTGDTITIPADSYRGVYLQLITNLSTSTYLNYTASQIVTGGRITRGDSSTKLGVVAQVYMSDMTITAGTDSSKTDTVTFAFKYANKNTPQTELTSTVTVNVTRTYDASENTITWTWTYSDTSSKFVSDSLIECYCKDVTADSTLSILGNPTYIDCDLGEAYKYEDGEVVSLNAHIDLGSNLPKLAPGSNTVTYDNTYTEVKVVPRWWKV